LGAVIGAQAALAQQQEASATMWRRATGMSSQSQRRRERERTARRAITNGADPARERSVAFWHEGGSGPTVLLINGWTASGLMWPSSLVRRLEERFRVVRIDNRGTGYSRSAPAPFTMAN